jgi:hypothetical protein
LKCFAPLSGPAFASPYAPPRQNEIGSNGDVNEPAYNSPHRRTKNKETNDEHHGCNQGEGAVEIPEPIPESCYHRFGAIINHFPPPSAHKSSAIARVLAAGAAQKSTTPTPGCFLTPSDREKNGSASTPGNEMREATKIVEI